jgi:uncharacterized protein
LAGSGHDVVDNYEVVNNEEKGRYELAADGWLAVLTYEWRGTQMALTHTIVPGEIEGRGIGTKLIVAALTDLRERAIPVVPICSFVRAYLKDHPEAMDGIAEEARWMVRA